MSSRRTPRPKRATKRKTAPASRARRSADAPEADVIAIDVSMDRREVEALALELQRLAVACGLSIPDVQVQAVSAPRRSRRG